MAMLREHFLVEYAEGVISGTIGAGAGDDAGGGEDAGA